MRPSPSWHNEVDGPNVGGVLAADQLESVAQLVHVCGERNLQLGFHAILFEAGVGAELEALVGQHIDQLDHQ